MKCFVAILFIIIVLSSCAHQASSLKPTIKDITQSVYAAGRVKSNRQYIVYPSASGIISKILVKEGDVVKEGQAIAVLQNDVARLTEENAKLAADYAAIPYNRERLQEAVTAIEMASAKASNDSLLWERQKNLWAMEIGSRNELEQRELAWLNSASVLQNARLKYRQLQKQLQLTAQQSRKTWQINSTVSSDYVLRSISDGRVYQVSKKPGEFVGAQTPLAIIGDANDFLLELEVDEQDIGSLNLGQKIWVTLESYEGQSFEAEITRILPLMDERSRALTVEAKFKNNPALLYPNMSVEANIVIATKARALLIPRNCLLEGNLVLMADGSKRKVITGLKDYQWVEILDGLQPDDEIQSPEQ